MNTRVLSILAIGISLSTAAQVNITQLGHVDYQALRNTNLSNLWGYTDEFGNEYALVGVNGVDMAVPPNPGGVSIVDVTDPALPVEVAFLASLPSSWREIKTWGDYAYVTTEAQAGLLIVDLSPLPGGAPTATTFTGNNWQSSHSLFIDENGRLYLNGSNRGNGGVIMYDLTQDPLNPVEVGEYDAFYVHDCFARGDTLYTAHINDGFFSVLNVSDPANPVLLGTQNSPNNFTHNIWLDDTGDHLYTTDEVSDSYIGSYDVSDLGDITLVDKLQSDPGSGSIVHNTYWLNGYLVQSYYTYGVTIYDASRPRNLVETGNFDTSPFSGNGFNGAWGVYPFLPSGNLIVSDIEGGLFVLAPTYAHASWLEGVVTDAQNSNAINNATVRILGTTVADVTGLDGRYYSGYHTPGTYDVRFSAPGYMADTIFGVSLASNTVTNLDVALVPLVPIMLTGYVVDASTNDEIPYAILTLTSETYSYGFGANFYGFFSIPVYEDTYTLTAGIWGHNEVCLTNLVFADTIAPITIPLDSGYHDGFALDLGWTFGGTATAGIWRRVEPVGQEFSGVELQTDLDIQDDCGDRCWLTGNGADIGTDDVQDGDTWIASPVMDLTGYIDPLLVWNYWYFDGSLNGNVDDSLSFFLRTGGNDFFLHAIHPNADMSLWTLDSAVVSDVATPAADMQLVVVANKPIDIGNHILECAFDVFSVQEHISEPDGVQEPSSFSGLRLFPNPAQDRVTILDTYTGGSTVVVSDARGREVFTSRMSGGALTIDRGLEPGVYSVLVVRSNGTRAISRLVMQ